MKEDCKTKSQRENDRKVKTSQGNANNRYQNNNASRSNRYVFNNSNNRSTNENGNSSGYRANVSKRVSRENNFPVYPERRQQVNLYEADINSRHNDSEHREVNYIDRNMERIILHDVNIAITA